MTRVASVGRSKSLLAAGALGFAFCTIVLTGCPGTLDPSFTMGAGAGAAGSTGSAAGMTGAGNTSGAAGAATGGGMVSMSPPPGFDVQPLFIGPNSKYKCSESAICHDASAGGANFSMAAGTNWMSHLIGVVPKGGGTVASICAQDPMFKTMPYIIKGDPNGDGLLLRKLSAAPSTEVCHPGGVPMPLTGTPIDTTTDLPNIKTWLKAMAALP